MGVSVSGSAVLVLVGLLVSFGIFYSAVSDGHERVSEARSEMASDTLDVRNGDLNITNATWTDDELTVEVDNTGSVEYTVNHTDVIVDNGYQTSFVERTVDGNSGTDLWLPGETLRIVVSTATRPDRVKIVTENGLADTEVI